MAGCICLTAGFPAIPPAHADPLPPSAPSAPASPLEKSSGQSSPGEPAPADAPSTPSTDKVASPGTKTPDLSEGLVRPALPDRGYLGVTLTEICPEVRAQTTLREGEGLMIGRVAPDSPASQLGLHHFDILTRFNDQWLMSPAQFVTLVENAGPDAEVELTFLRRGGEIKSKVKLGRAPAHPIAEATVAPPVEEMLTAVIRTLRDNPAVLESVHRALHGLPPGPGETEFDSIATALKRGARLTLRDESGEVELTQLGDVQQIRAWDSDGKLIFQGPCETPDQLAALPEGLRPRVERLQQECKKSIHSPGAAAPDKSQAVNKPGNQ
ncbi:MAG: degP [Verrucomicrobiales bacterium]|nr:degP [Verrucomicrobiales bacterium]